MQKSPLPNILYVVWFLFYWLLSALIISIFIPSDMGLAFKIATYMYAVSLLFSISPLAESWIRLSAGLKPLKMRSDLDKVQPVFEEVLGNARKLKPRLSSKIMLFVEERKEKHELLNAFAMGWKTLTISRDMINSLPERHLAGVIAHELGHFASLDTIGLLFSSTGNFVFVLLNKIILFFGGTILLKPIRWLLNSIDFIGKLILSPLSRRQELSADKFAFDCGYGDEILEVLRILYSMYGDGQGGIKGFLENTHPFLSDRIAKLEQYLSEYDPDILFHQDKDDSKTYSESYNSRPDQKTRTLDAATPVRHPRDVETGRRAGEYQPEELKAGMVSSVSLQPKNTFADAYKDIRHVNTTEPEHVYKQEPATLDRTPSFFGDSKNNAPSTNANKRKVNHYEEEFKILDDPDIYEEVRRTVFRQNPTDFDRTPPFFGGSKNNTPSTQGLDRSRRKMTYDHPRLDASKQKAMTEYRKQKFDN